MSTQVAPRQLIQVVATHYRLSLGDLRNARVPQCTRPRHIAMWLCRELLRLSFPEIGRVFGRDHSTIIEACKRINELLISDPEMQYELAAIKAQLSTTVPADRVCKACGRPMENDRQAVIDELRAELTRLGEKLRLMESTP